MKLANFTLYIKRFDWLTFLPALILTLFGLITLYSQNINATLFDLTLFNKQLVFFVIGIFLMLTITTIDFRIFRTYGLLIYVIAIIFMIAVLLWGSVTRGTRGWFYIFGFGLQPVEFTKLALIIMAALIYNRRKGKEKHITTILMLAGVTIIPAGLAMAQPDFGSALVILGIGFGFFAIISSNKKYFLWLLLGIMIISILWWNFGLIDYQKDRIITFLDPMRDPLGRGYNVRQSIIAIGSGQLLGRGLGLGTQSQLRFLPETSTDFIFANIAESLGFLGSSAIVILFAWLLIRFVTRMRQARSSFGAYLIYGFGIMFFVHAVINIGMNMGIMPVTGISLPFVSYGGSFLIISFIGIGIIESVSVRSKL